MKGRDRCTLLMHTADAQQRGVRTGDGVEVVSPTGKLQGLVEVTDAIKPGVVSLPHGWGHGRPGHPNVCCQWLTRRQHQRAVSVDVRRRTVGKRRAQRHSRDGRPRRPVHPSQFRATPQRGTITLIELAAQV
jgi:anaerobic selenocysteine-containing dehydrogenase